MSMRIEKSWVVYLSVENDAHDHCVDLFSRPAGTFGFEHFRRDVEDQGRWTALQYYSSVAYPTKAAAHLAAENAVGWFAEIIRQHEVIK